MIDNSKFTYDRSWEQIEKMLEQAEAEKSKHKLTILNKKVPMNMKEQPMRDFKGLQGVCNALRWVLGDREMGRQKVLGREK